VAEPDKRYRPDCADLTGSATADQSNPGSSKISTSLHACTAIKQVDVTARLFVERDWPAALCAVFGDFQRITEDPASLVSCHTPNSSGAW
jgi:hypothetical protein